MDRKMIKRIVIVGIIVVSVMGLAVFGIDLYIRQSTKDKIISVQQAQKLKDIDCIIILGAGIWGDRPSPMLEDRLQKGIELYNKDASPKIIMSGDHGRKEYDEVNLMKEYAIDKGIPSEDVFMDHAGFSTYESMYRARDIFEADKVIIVTQKYHMYRALHIANSLGIEAYGVNAALTRYKGEFYRETREILARNKDFITCLYKPKPTYLGERIPVSGSGDATNDK